MELTYIQSRFDAFFTILEHLLKSSVKTHVGLKVRYGGWGMGYGNSFTPKIPETA